MLRVGDDDGLAAALEHLRRRGAARSSRAPRQRDVEQEALERAATVRPRTPRRPASRSHSQLPVGRQEPVLQLVVFAACQAGAAQLDDGVALVGVELAAPEPGGVPGLRGVARDLLDLWADVGEALLLGIGGPGHHLGGLDQAAEALLAGLELVLGALALGDVLDGPDHAPRAPALVEHHIRPRVHVAHGAVGQTSRDSRWRTATARPAHLRKRACRRGRSSGCTRSNRDSRVGTKLLGSAPTMRIGLLGPGQAVAVQVAFPASHFARPAGPSAGRPRARAAPPRRASAR